MRNLLQDITNICSEESEFIFTYMHAKRDQRIRFTPQTPIVDSWLHYQKEPFTWGIETQALCELLRDYSIAMIESVSSEQLHQAYEMEEQQYRGTPPQGEYVCRCLL